MVSDEVSLATINHSVVPDKVKSHGTNPEGSLMPSRKPPAQRQRRYGESGPLRTAGGNGNSALAVNRLNRVII